MEGRFTKLVPIDELLQVVTEAGMLHQRDFYETSLSRLVAGDGDPLGDLSTADELASSLGIPKERLDAAIANRYPPAAEQLAELESHGAVATTHAVARTYQAELLRVLRGALPSMHFEGELEKTGRLFDQPYLDVPWRQDYTVGILLVKESVPVRVRPRWHDRFRLRPAGDDVEHRRDEVLLARIQVGNEFLPHADPARSRASDTRLHRGLRIHLVITVRSGVFIRLCGRKLAELRDRFRKHNGISGHEVRYDYVVQEEQQLG